MSKLMEPLSDSKVRQALGEDVRILKYSELKNYETMNELLPSLNTFFICLLEEDFNRGHWTAMMRLKNCFYYFNSYGERFDSDLSVIPMCIRKILGEDKREFSRLLDGQSCDWNRVKLQGEKSMVCGRWCILVITMCCFMGYSPAEFVAFVKEKAKILGKSCDEVVCQIVNI
jgi:hypothetical protein